MFHVEQSLMTHAQIVELAVKWLSRRCSVIVSEMATHGEEADAIGWKSGGDSYLVECKTSQSDFVADRRKLWREHPQLGMGRNRYFLIARDSGIKVKVGDLNGWGLLEAHNGRVKQVVGAAPFPQWNVKHEATVLLSSIRRIGTTAPRGISVKVYTHQTRCRAAISIDSK